MEFPYSIYSKYSADDEPQQSSIHNNSSNNEGSLDSKVNNIARGIANVVIKSAANDEDEDKPSATLPLPQIPVDILLYAAVIISKVLLFSSYKAAKQHGIEILDL